MDDILCNLSKLGFEILSINSNENWLLNNAYFDIVRNDSYEIVNDDYKKIFFHSKDDFEKKTLSIVKKYNPDIIFSQLNFLNELNSYCKNHTCKIIYFFHSISKVLDNELSILSSENVDSIFCFSEYIFNSIPSQLKNKTTIIYPIFPHEKYFVNIKEKGKKIIFFNPIYEKGIDVIIELLRAFPNKEFLICETWKRTSNIVLKKLLEFDNVEVIQMTEIKKIMLLAYLFLLPSQIEEGFGRGVIEFNINSIPVIASNVGGIPEAMGNNQLLINEFDNANEWIIAINEILNFDTYNNYAKIAKNNSIRFLSNQTINNLLRRLK